MPSKSIQFLKRVDKRFLSHVMRVFDRSQNAHERVEQPVLIARNQITKRMRLAGEALSNEFLIGFRHL
jgi:hypothetical protein